MNLDPQDLSPAAPPENGPTGPAAPPDTSIPMEDMAGKCHHDQTHGKESFIILCVCVYRTVDCACCNSEFGLLAPYTVSGQSPLMLIWYYTVVTVPVATDLLFIKAVDMILGFSTCFS